MEALKRDLAGVPGTLPQIALRFCLSHKAVTTRHSGHAAHRDGREQLPRGGGGHAGCSGRWRF